MRYLLALVFVSFFLSSCDDGDVIAINLDFDDSISVEECDDLVFYKSKTDPTESLSISMNGLTMEELLAFNEQLESPEESKITTRTINGNSNKFNYRRYLGEVNFSTLFCNAIPPDIDILTDDESTSGEIIITTTVVEHDNDGIPTEDEDDNTDGDNNPATNPTDTDGDTIPDYLDFDDDGDNVPTKDEDDNTDGDNNPATNPTDTDGDTIPDYLDTDDDGDGVDTRDEENNTQNENPRDDITNSGEGPDYLNPNVSTTVAATAYTSHTVIRNFTIQVTVEDFNLSFLSQQTYDFGSIEETQSLPIEAIFN